MQLFDVYPLNDITIVKGEGSWVWDDRGQRYLDLYGGHAVISIGHSHPHYVQRLTGQLSRIGFYSNSVKIPQQEELAGVLGRISGKDDYQLFLINSGAEANENALKLASFHTGRQQIIAFTGAFHGRTSLAVAATDNPAIAAPVNKTGNITFLPYNDPAALEEYFQKNGDRVAGVILECIQGVGGIRVADQAFVQTIRTLCDRHGTLLIADEVQCGYGRTGRFFALDHYGVPADIYTMAKGMGNGFPVAGILIAPHIRPKHGLLGTTFGGNHLACAAALAVLEVMEAEDLMSHAARTGRQLMETLTGMEGLQHIRGRGLMIGFDPAQEGSTLRKVLLLKHHIFTGEAKPHTIRLLPALNIGPEETALLVAAIRTESEVFV